ncbi:hypothetical protein BaRGS_00026559, partial [Batillaria attramentaria]
MPATLKAAQCTLYDASTCAEENRPLPIDYHYPRWPAGMTVRPAAWEEFAAILCKGQKAIRTKSGLIAQPRAIQPSMPRNHAFTAQHSDADTIRHPYISG